MAKAKHRGLTEAQKAFLVQHLACYDTPSETAGAFKEEYGLEITPQRVEQYDPTKKAGQKLSKKWADIFRDTRKGFLAHVEEYIPEANKAVRVRHLIHAARAFKAKSNYVGMADMLERVAKELGNVHSNRREISGRDGKPIEFADLSEEQIEARLTALLNTVSTEDVGHDGDGSGSREQPSATRH